MWKESFKVYLPLFICCIVLKRHARSDDLKVLAKILVQILACPIRLLIKRNLARFEEVQIILLLHSHSAEAERFERSVGCPTPVFKTGALDLYATPPCIAHLVYSF